MIEIKRKQNEPIGSFLRRFSRRVIQSGMIKRARGRRYYVPAKTKREVRLSALYRAQTAVDMAREARLGKVKEEKKGGRRRF